MHKVRYLYKGRLAFSSHDQIANLIIQYRAKRVLDIGCSRGFIGQALREKNWENNLIGLDKDKSCDVIIKGSKYNQFLNLDVEKNINKIPGAYDAVVFADVLEHLNDPLKVLIQTKRILMPNGKIYISLPNVANFSIRLHILSGKFNYQDFGILDKDHRLFYTLRTAKQLIKQTGLTIIKSSFTPIPTPFLSRNKNFKKPLSLLYLLARLLLSIRKELFAYQFIFVCEKNDRK